MAGLSDLFIDPSTIRNDGFGMFQLVFLMLMYGYILYRASKLIADGSDLLSIVLDPGLVGGLVLPVMGAVPDGAIVLFSGMGPDAQAQLKVGVGTLAGSTIMLVTVPWAVCALLGRVDIADDGKGDCVYSPPKGLPKLTKGYSLTRTGVQPPSTIRTAAKICIATALTYLVIQGPSFYYDNGSEATGTQAMRERYFALTGAIMAVVAFLGYSAYCVLSAGAIEKQKARLTEIRRTAVANHIVSMATLVEIETELAEAAAAAAASSSSSASPSSDDSSLLASEPGSASSTKTTPTPATTTILRSMFDKYDVDLSGELDKGEVKAMLVSMGMKVDRQTLTALLRDLGGIDLKIQFSEFQDLIRRFLALHRNRLVAGDGKVLTQDEHAQVHTVVHDHAINDGGRSEDSDEDEEEEEEEEDTGLSPSQIKMRGYGILLLGVAVVTVFSDPMVDVLTELGARMAVSPFYISFIITPIVSNASELISSMQSATRKTRKSIDMTYSQLYGAATMNNTFCLAIFLVLVYAQDLAWQFSAETISILAVQAAIVVITLTSKRDVLPLWKAAAIGMLYPASLLLVYLLENVAGLD